MKTINVTNARKTIYSLLKEVDDHHSPILITGKHNNAVLVSEEEWNSIQETLFLSQNQNISNSIVSGAKEPLSECTPEELIYRSRKKSKISCSRLVKIEIFQLIFFHNNILKRNKEKNS